MAPNTQGRKTHKPTEATISRLRKQVETKRQLRNKLRDEVDLADEKVDASEMKLRVMPDRMRMVTEEIKRREEQAEVKKNVKVEKEKFRCGICDEVYTSEGKTIPKLLKCGHTVCAECLQNICKDYFAKCPFDNVFLCRVDVDSGSFPINHYLVEFNKD